MGYSVVMYRNRIDFEDRNLDEDVTPIFETSITSNYSGQFAVVLGKDRLYELYGKTGKESTLILEQAIESLVPPVWGQEEYGHKPALNASAALVELLIQAAKRPDGVWWVCA